MNRLPRPIADWFALWRDLPHHPRQVLLNRSHLSGSTVLLILALLSDLIATHPVTTIVAYTALIALGPSSLVAFLGTIAHHLWERGRIWSDLECQFCADPGGDDGWDDDPDPDPGPDDGWLRELTEYLNTHTLTHA